MKKYIYIAVFAVVFLSSGLTALAANNPCNASTGNGNLGYCPLEPIQGFTLGTTNADVPTFLRGLFRILFSLAALLAVVRLVIGGIMYMTSDVAGNKSQAKKWAMSSLYGLLILAGSYLILNTINPDLIKINFIVPTTGRVVNPTPAKTDTTTTGSTPPPAPGGALGPTASTISKLPTINFDLPPTTAQQTALNKMTTDCTKAGGIVEFTNTSLIDATKQTAQCQPLVLNKL